ncbi:MAG: cytochrome-c peroxidase, partial [Endozoicomonas sp.]
MRFALAIFALLAAACGGGDSESTIPGKESSVSQGEGLQERVRWLARQRGLDGIPDGVDDAVLPPGDSPIARLGQLLFFSRTLSMDYDVACATCHHPLLAGSDGLSLPVGVAAQTPYQLGPGRSVDAPLDKDPSSDCAAAMVAPCGPNVARNSQTVFNSGLYRNALFHDGRIQVVGAAPDGAPLVRTPESSVSAIPMDQSGLLFHQAQEPLVASREMRGFGHAEMTSDAIRKRLVDRFLGIEPPGQDYVTEQEAAVWTEYFTAAFPEMPEQDRISLKTIQTALAAYQKSLTFVQTPWSRFIRGESDLGETALRGAELFWANVEEGGLGCYKCHSGDLHTDESFHNVGFPQIGRGKRSDGSDPGRQGVTRREEDSHKFRTPALHNVRLTAPYGHAGSFQTLEEAIRWHASPLRGVLDQSWSGLEQFKNDELLSRYPQALTLT